MTDREHVIWDIERCICHVPDACKDCSHYHGVIGIGCMEELLTDAFAMLKEQEPRVLTIDEVNKAEVCWLEERGYEPYATLDAYTWNSEKYDKSYRCWSCKPTDEQRKAVKWDGTY